MRSGLGPRARQSDGRQRQRLRLRDELLLALLPTLTVLAVLRLLEAAGAQPLLFASLASSAFLIYLDPLHATNTTRTLVVSHAVAVALGLLAFLAFGHGYGAAAAAMVGTILAMVVLSATHPPAVSTALSFALRAGTEGEVPHFALALAMVAALVLLQRATARLFVRWEAGAVGGGSPPDGAAVPPDAARKGRGADGRA